VSVSYFRRLYGSHAPGLDIGTNRQSMQLLASFDVRRFDVDTNAVVTEQISDQPAVHRAQFGQTLSISHLLHGHLGLSGELVALLSAIFKSNSAGLLLALSYAVNRLLLLDGGFNRGLTGSSTRWEGFVGLTYLFLKRLW
jgi:hypothetical protein